MRAGHPLVLLLASLTLPAGALLQARPAADRIVTNAKIFTGDPAHPEAEAVAVLGDRIVAVGPGDEVSAWRGPATHVIDAGGRRVVPGFNDAHVHFVSGGMDLDNVDLKDAKDTEEFVKRIAERAARTPKGEWLLGGNWDDQNWTPAKLPDRALIDRVTPTTPVFLSRYDGHMALANSVALRLSGVTAKTPDPPGGEIVRGALKGYADGSLGSTTAYFFEPYLDAPSTRGLLSDEMQPLDAMRDRMTKADADGLQLCVHAIGDRGISMILDLYGDVARSNGERDRRFRIEHAQHVAPKDFERFAALHVIASMQPYHAIDDGRWAEKRIGPERIRTTYAFRTFLDRGVRLAFGTDWSVAPLDPMQTIYAAATRATLDGRNPDGWVPEQKITVREAVEAYTKGSAYAEFQEKEKGTIAPGMLADLVILSADIFSIDPRALRDVKVLTTIVGGRVVWDSSATH